MACGSEKLGATLLGVPGVFFIPGRPRHRFIV